MRIRRYSIPHSWAFSELSIMSYAYVFCNFFERRAIRKILHRHPGSYEVDKNNPKHLPLVRRGVSFVLRQKESPAQKARREERNKAYREKRLSSISKQSN